MKDEQATWVEEPASEAMVPPVVDLGERYRDLAAIGKGGMGEVRRVYDAVLERTVAMKLLRNASPRGIDRFTAEAKLTAQLQHPGIVSVHDFGTRPDGQLFFTMDEVRGDLLTDAVGTRSVRRLVEAFRRVCETIAYAHDRGVLHRDLKPDNILLGPFGEVVVADWGLAVVVQQQSATTEAPEPIHSTQSQSSASGEVVGTPAYMPPEQAAGALVDARSDVYSLGAVLYHLLTGRRPYRGKAKQVLSAVLRESPTPIEHGPADLQRIVARAMARHPDDRYPDARALAADVGAWLAGELEEDRAHALVRDADELMPSIAEVRTRAIGLRHEALEILEAVPTHAPSVRKEAGWVLEDEATLLEREAAVHEVEYLQTLRAALSHAEIPEARARLADFYRQQHEAAENRRDRAAAARHEVLLAAYDDGRHAAYLAGDARLTLRTDPPGARVIAYPTELRGRRMVDGEGRHLGRTPIDLRLPMGTWTLAVHAHDRVVRIPVALNRGDHWENRDPDGVIRPARTDVEVGPDECLVASGWADLGGDAEAFNAWDGHRVWVDDFAIARFPVTNRQFIAFLDDLVERGREADALAYVPRTRVGLQMTAGEVIYGRSESGGFRLIPDPEGDLWEPDWPVLMVTWWAAVAYAAWLAEHTGQPWRLPTEREWEKAARGVDGRTFPWGWMPEPSWACIGASHAGSARPAEVDSHPIDTSPYGARGMVGNIRDWCDASDDIDPERRVFRGGDWDASITAARCGSRHSNHANYRSPSIGFRVARSV